MAADLAHAHTAETAQGHQNLAFSLSRLLAQKMASARGKALAAVGGGEAGVRWWNAPAEGSAEEEEREPDFLITRCPLTTLAVLDEEGGCSCGKLDSSQTSCHGYDENDRRAICIEDLRSDAERWAVLEAPLAGAEGNAGHAAKRKAERSKRRRATCGLEFLPSFERPSGSCPIGYARIGDPDDEDAPFICQDTASPYSADCTKNECEIMMCQEGWRFHVITDDEAAAGVGVSGGASCVPAKPLFFAPPAV
ncbi:hypothetical protein JCM10213v2_009278 [Rhodosporidiobolus nylandii]